MTLAEVERTNRTEAPEATQLRNDFWTNVEHYRKAQGLTPTYITYVPGMTGTYWALRAARRMSPTIIATLSRALDVPVALLMDQTAAATRYQED